MKLLYLNITNGGAGLRKKIDAQLKGLRSLGVETELLDMLLKHENSSESGRLESSIWNTLRRRRSLLDESSMLLKTGDFDVLYMRYPGADPFVLRWIRKQEIPVVTEHQTIETVEFRTRSKLPRMKTMLEATIGGKIISSASALVGVTREICEYELSRSHDGNKPCFVMGNGIDVSSVPLRRSPEFVGDRLELLSVSSVAIWHGLDRIIHGLAQYRGDVDVQLHIVGDGPEVPNLKELAADLKLEDSVVFHGLRTGEELDAFFDKCHIAVGSLAIHRAGSGSPLKSKEYCARGIPFVDSVNDEDFDDNFPFRLKLTSDDTPIGIEELVSFTRSALSDSSQAEQIRCYAQERLDWSVKMKRLKDFFEEIMKS